jgi:hypothetical protein
MSGAIAAFVHGKHFVVIQVIKMRLSSVIAIYWCAIGYSHGDVLVNPASPGKAILVG